MAHMMVAQSGFWAPSRPIYDVYSVVNVACFPIEEQKCILKASVMIVASG